MRKCILALLIGTQQIVFAQPPPAEYNRLVQKADSLYQMKLFKESAYTFTEAFKINGWKGYIPDLYYAARAWAMTGNADSAFRKLDRVITYASHSEFRNYRNFPDEPAFKSLHGDTRWKSAIQKADKKFNNPLTLQLDSILYEDQKYRLEMDTLYKKYGPGSDEVKVMFEKMRRVDSLNLVKVKRIIAMNGWPGIDEVGREGNNTIFLVLQHADSATQEEYLPIFRQAVREGKALSNQLAYFEDRVAIRRGEKQIYGTQIGTDHETGEYIVLPLKDPDLVDIRRKEVGLPPLADYVRRWGINWNVDEYKKKMEQSDK